MFAVTTSWGINPYSEYLGEENAFKVFAAELTAMDLAMEMMKDTGTRYNKHVIFADSQSAAKAVIKPKQ